MICHTTAIYRAEKITADGFFNSYDIVQINVFQTKPARGIKM